MTVGVECGFFVFYVCAEVDLSERKPGHAEGAAVCSDTSLARYNG